MNFKNLRKDPISFLKILVVFIFLLFLFSDWANFKAGLFGKQPIEIVVKK